MDELLRNSVAVLQYSTSRYVIYWNLSQIRNTMWSAAVLQRSGSLATFPQWYIFIYKPGENKEKTVPKNPKPMLSGPDGSHLSLFQIAAYSSCLISLWCLRANESIFLPPEHFGSAGRMISAVARPLKTGLSTLPVSPSPSAKPVVVRPIICCNLPKQELF